MVNLNIIRHCDFQYIELFQHNQVKMSDIDVHKMCYTHELLNI